MNISFSIETPDRNRLDPSVQSLLDAACQALDQAYAPYSGFRVAASLRLSDGRILTGTNQENASYPVGICAERVAISAVNSIAPGAIVESMAIAYRPSGGVVALAALHGVRGSGFAQINPTGGGRPRASAVAKTGHDVGRGARREHGLGPWRRGRRPKR